MEQKKTNGAKQTVILILKWIFSVIFFLSALMATFKDGAIIAGLAFLLMALILLPPLSPILTGKIPFMANRYVKIGILVGLMVVVGGTVPKRTAKEQTAKQQETEKKDTSTVASINGSTTVVDADGNETKVEPPKMPSYKIVHEAVIRYDNGKSYFVLMEKVDLSNDGFMEDVKRIVSDISKAKATKKLNIELFDDKSTLELTYKSHYGINTLRRPLTKSERTSLERHYIASFSGELATMPDPYSLSYFPSAFKDSKEVGKFRKDVDYEP